MLLCHSQASPVLLQLKLVHHVMEVVVHVQVQTCSNYSAHALPTPTPLVHQDLGFHAQAALPPLLLHSRRLCLRPPLRTSPQLACHSPLHLPPSLNKLPSP